jgi:hypothetical protein
MSRQEKHGIKTRKELGTEGKKEKDIKAETFFIHQREGEGES